MTAVFCYLYYILVIYCILIYKNIRIFAYLIHIAMLIMCTSLISNVKKVLYFLIIHRGYWHICSNVHKSMHIHANSVFYPQLLSKGLFIRPKSTFYPRLYPAYFAIL